MKKAVYLLLTGCIIIACVREESKIKYSFVTEFPQVLIPTGEEFGTPEYFKISKLIIIDTLLVVLSRQDNSYIQIYSTISQQLLGSLSRRGRGPGEFITPDIINHVEDADSTFCFIFDSGDRTITKIEILRSIKENRYIYERQNLSIPTSYDRIGKLFYVGHQYYIFKEAELKSRLSIHHRESGKRFDIPYNYPSSNFLIREEEEKWTFFSEAVANPSLDRIAAAPRRIGQIDFFSMKGEYLSTTMYSDYKQMAEALKESYNSIEPTRAYIVKNGTLLSNNDTLFLLHHNYRDGFYIKDGEKEPDLLPRPWTTGHTNELMVFDWFGKPLKKIKFDRFVSDYAIDSKYNSIYAVCPQPEGNEIIVKYRY